VKKADSAAKLFEHIEDRVATMVTDNIIAPIMAIDKGELDGYV